MSSEISVTVPDLGDFKSVDVVEVLVQVGDVVEINTPLATLETEKATMDVPSTVAGRVTAVLIARGSKVASGSAVVTVEAATPTSVSTAPSQATAAAPVVAASAAEVSPNIGLIEVAVPALGDFKSVDVVEVLAKVGDVVDVDTPLATLETEKATMDVPSTAAGQVVEVLIARGDKVASGTIVVKLAPSGATASTPAVPAVAAVVPTAPSTVPAAKAPAPALPADRKSVV